jgi:hypothetical protein
MHTFIVDQKLLQQLSPAARRELLALLTEDLQETKAQFKDYNWDPEGQESYPLSVEEANVLIGGMPEEALNAMPCLSTTSMATGDMRLSNSCWRQRATANTKTC